MNRILEIYDGSAVGKAKIEGAILKLSTTSGRKIAQQVKRMVYSERELQVLLQVQREVGAKALTSSIDDIQSGGKKLKRALSQTKEKLTSKLLSATNKYDKEKIRKSLKFIDVSLKKDLHNHVLNRTLAPFTANGRMPMKGEEVAKVLEVVDQEYQDDQVREVKIKGASIHKARMRREALRKKRK